MSNENDNKGKAGAGANTTAATKPEKVKNVKLVAVHEVILPDELGQRQVVAPKAEFNTDAATAEQLLKAGAAVKPKAAKAEAEGEPTA